MRSTAPSVGRERAEIVVVGAGMVGLTLAMDLVKQGLSVVVLEKTSGVAEGSRSICQAKRSLEIWDRLGIGEAIRDRGSTWRVGRVFHKDQELFRFDLLPEPGHKMPAFVNLQQPILEVLLHDRFRELGGEVRFGHELVDVGTHEDGASITVRTSAGDYALDADWLVSCEGARSTVRRALGLPFEGEIFEDKFLISDVRMKAPFPPERWFWFEPPFHPGQTALLHRQADDVWRIDLQLGWDADAEVEKQPERVRDRIAAMLGHGEFEFEWISLYVFQCRTLESYVRGRVIFAGDSAHQVSPFGARGGNGGVQDADNLAWKLARVARARAGGRLLQSYDQERLFAARENIRHSRRATSFMTPRTSASRHLRDETLRLAAEAPFARALVNAGRLSTPAHFSTSSLNTPDEAHWIAPATAPGSPAVDAPVRRSGRDGHLLESLGDRFVLLASHDADAPSSIRVGEEEVCVLQLGRDLEDREGLLASRYDLDPQSVVLFRPDQHVTMRSRALEPERVADAVRRALALQPEVVS